MNLDSVQMDDITQEFLSVLVPKTVFAQLSFQWEPFEGTVSTAFRFHHETQYTNK